MEKYMYLCTDLKKQLKSINIMLELIIISVIIMIVENGIIEHGNFKSWFEDIKKVEE